MTVHDGSGLGSDPNADDPELWPVAKLKKTLKRLGRMPDPRTILEKPELIGLVQDAIANGSPFPKFRFLLLLEPFRHFHYFPGGFVGPIPCAQSICAVSVVG